MYVCMHTSRSLHVGSQAGMYVYMYVWCRVAVSIAPPSVMVLQTLSPKP